jgi:hypothetical protein
MHSDRAMFQILVWPGRGGTRRLRGAADSLPRARQAILAFTLPERGIEPPGADTLVTDFGKITLEDDFDVPAR